jgi:hypothetical protein
LNILLKLDHLLLETKTEIAYLDCLLHYSIIRLSFMIYVSVVFVASFD